MKRSICFLFALAFLVGCQNFQPMTTEAAPAAAAPAPAPAPTPAPQWQGTRFDDVPIPSSFTLDYDASYINISGSGRHPRVADIRYTGETPLSDALSNVQQGMLGSGWSLVSISGVDIKSLRFLKASEECQIIVRSDHDDTTVIIVRLYPRD